MRHWTSKKLSRSAVLTRDQRPELHGVQLHVQRGDHRPGAGMFAHGWSKPDSIEGSVDGAERTATWGNFAIFHSALLDCCTTISSSRNPNSTAGMLVCRNLTQHRLQP